MSMFHELMMRKKEQIMYATIKGTLTENDGVFSGFSDGKNYLLMQQSFTPQDKSWKIRATFTTGSDRENAKVLFVGNTGTGNYGGFVFGTYSRHFWFNIGSTGTSWNIQTTGQSTNVIEINTQYTVEFGFTGTEYFIDNIENGVATRVFTVSSSTPIYQNGSFTIGLRLNDSNNWIGSIDLNNSYIKIGATKYNLQAVVGYTIVGSPTIVDGVVSGFTTSDYIRINPFNNIGTQDFELATAFITNTSISMRIIATYGTSGTYTGLAITNLGVIRFTVYNGVNQYIATSSQTYQTGTKYYIKCYRKGTEVGIKVSTDNVNWITDTTVIPENTNLVSGSEFLDFGVNRYGGSALNGSIDLNNTYIKINNKLWFNGQQA